MAATSELSGRVAVVTGAASGMGRASATAFGAAGASVALVDINGPGARRVASQIEDASGVATTVIEADLTDTAQIRATFERVVAEFGQVDCLANVAGIWPDASVLDTTEELWDGVMALNLRGVFFCCREAMRLMFERGSGCIVNVASGAAFVGLRNNSAYAASKAGLVAMSRTMALEGARRGVRVNVVAPGATRSETILATRQPEEMERIARHLPYGRWLEPEEIAEAIVFLCTDRASGITGDIINVTGGSYMPSG